MISRSPKLWAFLCCLLLWVTTSFPSAAAQNGAPTQLRADEQVYWLKQISISIPEGSSQAESDRLIAEFKRTTAALRGCEDTTTAQSAIGAQVVENNRIKAIALPRSVRDMVASLEVGEVTPAFGSTEQVKVLMLCARRWPEKHFLNPKPSVASHAASPVASAPAAESKGQTLEVFEANGPRIALIIGNQKYSDAMGDLSNPVNDAQLIGSTLRQLGFDVEVLTDADQKSMKQAVQRLGERLLEAGDNATGLFFYAGHGVQSKGINYLIPIGSGIRAESELELEAVSANAVLAMMEETYVSTRIIILDACRNMPLRRRTRDGTRGLAQMEAPNGSFVAYSTGPGSTADDGTGQHSPFAKALAAQIIVPGRSIDDTFQAVRRDVFEQTDGDQTPWVLSSLLERFSFVTEQ